jgi:hypothetical protein
MSCKLQKACYQHAHERAVRTAGRLRPRTRSDRVTRASATSTPLAINRRSRRTCGTGRTVRNLRRLAADDLSGLHYAGPTAVPLTVRSLGGLFAGHSPTWAATARIFNTICIFSQALNSNYLFSGKWNRARRKTFVSREFGRSNAQFSPVEGTALIGLFGADHRDLRPRWRPSQYRAHSGGLARDHVSALDHRNRGGFNG